MPKNYLINNKILNLVWGANETTRLNVGKKKNILLQQQLA